jgi:transcription antitermination factor NusG
MMSLEVASSNCEEQYLFPPNLFEECVDAPGTFWTCVRSRPRWEKKLAGFLHARSVGYYLPVVSRFTYTGRKRRNTLHPLFPGFLFVRGNHNKEAFKESGCVVYLLKPASATETAALDRQIRLVRRLTVEKNSAQLSNEYQMGEHVEIVSGPLKGVCGRVLRVGNAQKLVVGVDLLGVGVSVVLGPESELARIAEVASS